MSREFLNTSSLENAYSIINQHVPLGTSSETLSLTTAFKRITSVDLISPEDLPPFPRSTVDGFAVKAADTFGASEGTPIYLDLIGEVMMGGHEIVPLTGTQHAASLKDVGISDHTAIRIPTGGMLPEGADGVVMVEYTQPYQGDTEKKEMIEVTRPVAPGEHVIQAGEDFKKGSPLFSKGHQLRAQDIGVLAALGITQVQVYRRPKIAILSTGPEICPVDQKPKRGQVRDINAHTLAAMIEESGCDPIHLGIFPDDLEKIKQAIRKGIKQADCVLVSGGSSVGTRDYTFQAITDLGPPGVLLHGLSIRPGKPTIIGQSDMVPIIGLPGHPSSTMVVAQAIVRLLLSRLAGLTAPPLETQIRSSSGSVKARMTRNIASSPGKEDFVRIALSIDEEDDSHLLATPVFGKSGLISTLMKAHGLLRIPADAEGVYAGEEVKIHLF